MELAIRKRGLKYPAESPALRMRSQNEIEQILSAAVRAATARHTTAAAEFQSMLDGISSGKGCPNAAFQIQRTHAETGNALEAFRRALDKFSEFVMNGTVPEELL